MPRLEFKGKSSVANLHYAVPYHALVPVAKKGLSKAPSLEDNLIIHGDNLKALKSLLPTYAGRVKCIYIDPPYNTGNEGWAYNDNVNSPMIKDWLGKTVDREDLTRHDKWLAMMMPRLKLLRELLADDGAIFVSIDDNEVHHLRMLMDEIFGENCFVTQIEWQKRYTRSNNTDNFTTIVEHIVVYSHSEGFKPKLVARNEEANDRYDNPDNDPRGPWKLIPFTNPLSPEERPNLVYKILQPNTGKTLMPSKKAWRSSKEAFDKLVSENRIWWGKDGKSDSPGVKRFLSEVREGMTPVNFWDYEFAGHTDYAGNEIKEIFGEKIFETPKPSSLVRRVIEVACSDDDIILDSFAGSGTTAHAVLALNKEDGGHRRFITIETEDYADKVTAERVRRVIKGVPGAKDENLKKGLGGTFSYFELGESIEVNKMLTGEALPSYDELARYVFHTATGQAFDAKKMNKKTGLIGSAGDRDIYLIYEPNVEKLKGLALSLDTVAAMGPAKPGRTRLVFAPAKYLDSETMQDQRVEFAQLPFEIFRRFLDSRLRGNDGTRGNDGKK